MSEWSTIQPVPEEWEVLFVVGFTLSLIVALLAYVKRRSVFERWLVVLVVTAVAATMALAIVNAKYLHRFEPVPGEQDSLRVLPGPLWKCQALDDYRQAIGPQAAIGPDEWRQKVYSPGCKGATIAGGTLALFCFTLTSTLLFLLLIHAVNVIASKGKPLLKSLSAFKKLFSGG